MKLNSNTGKNNSDHKTKAGLSLGLNLNLNKLPLAAAAVIAIVAVVLIIWLALGAPSPLGTPQATQTTTPEMASQTADEPTAGAVDIDTPININTADITTLQKLPGIGEVRARSIVEYREQNGSFTAIEDIQNVKGIGPEIFAQIKERIRI